MEIARLRCGCDVIIQAHGCIKSCNQVLGCLLPTSQSPILMVFKMIFWACLAGAMRMSSVLSLSWSLFCLIQILMSLRQALQWPHPACSCQKPGRVAWHPHIGGCGCHASVKHHIIWGTCKQWIPGVQKQNLVAPRPINTAHRVWGFIADIHHLVLVFYVHMIETSAKQVLQCQFLSSA